MCQLHGNQREEGYYLSPVFILLLSLPSWDVGSEPNLHIKWVAGPLAQK